jgi:iron complex transport system substrate-binding protein
MRVVSFLPSATETLFALGAGDLLCGRSHECDHPAEVRDLPVVCRSLVRRDATPGEIHESLWRTFSEGTGHFEIDVGRLRKLDPDLLITQDTCSVCALTTEEVRRAAESLDRPPEVLALSAHSLDGVFRDMERLGKAVGREGAARELVAGLKERLDSLRRSRPPRSEWPRVAYLEWFDPLMAGGDWAPELLEVAGAQDLFGKAGGPSTMLDWDQLGAQDPDVLILGPCGFDVERAEKDLPELCSSPGWARLHAPRAGRAWLVNGKAFFSRPGPRLVRGAEVVARIFHPERGGPLPGRPDAIPVGPSGSILTRFGSSSLSAE